MKTKPRAVVSFRDRISSLPLLGALLGLALPFGGDLHADVLPTSLTIRDKTPDIEGRQSFQLEWNSLSNATYLVQSAASLAPGSPWTMLISVVPTAGTYVFDLQVTDDLGLPSQAKFFRLTLPQPQIFTVEPAVFAPGTTVDAYVIGQCFESNDVVRVDGVVVSMIYLSHNMLQGPLPTLSAGRHLVELVRDGVVKSSFTVMCADAVTNPELVLQGPPEAPLASPYRVLKTKTKSNQSNDRVFKPKTKSNQSNDRFAAGGDDGSGLGINSQGNRGAVIQFDVVNAKNPLLGSIHGGVQPFSGEVQLAAADLVISGRGLDFIWARTYRSRTGPSTAQGAGWDFSYNVSLAMQSDGSVVLGSGNGRADAFYPNSTGGWSRPEYFVEIGDVDVDGFPDVVTFADSGKWVFHSLLGTTAPGKLSQIVDRNGNTMKLHYDGGGQLIEVVDDLDRTNTVAYNLAGQIASVTDFSGRTVRYEYDSNSNLVTCISPAVIGTPNGNDFPGGKTNTYTYLTTVTPSVVLSYQDAFSNPVAQFSYDLDPMSPTYLRCTALRRGTNLPTLLTYLPQTPTPANQFATLRCLVNDPVGNVTGSSFDARNRCVKLEQFTGRATPGMPVTYTVNQPSGKLRSSDPNAFVTRWQWNNDSLCTLVTLPGGQQLQRIYESDFDAATLPRKRADCRVVREIASSPVDVDGDGVGDLTERTWRYEYDPRFGSDATASRVMRLMDIARERSGDPFLIKDIQVGEVCDDNNTTSGDGCNSDNKVNRTAGEQCDNGMGNNRDSFVISVTDPRGIVTTSEFDPNGNLTRRIVIPVVPANQPTAAPPTAAFVYNSHGQLTAITNAADANGFRRVDTFSYYTNGTQVGLLEVMIADAMAGGLALTTTFEYDPRGNMTRFVNPRGHDVLYTYNALNQLVRYQTPTNLTARTATDFTYDANDNLVRVETERRDENDFVITSLPTRGTLRQYDTLNRCTEIVRQVSINSFITNRFFYDANDNVVAVHSPLAVSGADSHALTQLAYDERNMPFQTIAAPGSSVQSTTQWDYDANGNVTRVSEGLEGTPRITTLEYDGFATVGAGAGRGFYALPEVGDELGSSSFEHGDIKQPVVLGSVWGSSTSLQKYRGSGTMYDVDVASSSSLEFLAGARFAAAGATCAWSDGIVIRPAKITDPNGNVTTFSYDANDNLKVFRHFGQLNDTPGTNGNIRLAESRWKYDGLDRPIEARAAFFNPATQAPIGDGASVTTFAYPPNGQCTNVTDDLGRTTRFGYDTAGRHLSTTDARGNIRVAVLDAFGNCVTTTSIELSDLGGSPQVFSRTNVYDAWNRLVSTKDNVGNNRNWSFGGDSTLLRAVDARGAITRHEYDLLSRRTKTFQDMNDNDLVEAEDIVITQTWDDNSRLVSVTDDNTNTTYYTYDSLGRQVLATSPDGTAQSFVWNTSNNLVREQDANGTVITNSYDLLGRCIRRDITPGPGIAATTTFETFAYDGVSRLVAATNNVSQSEFDYDSLGNCTDNHTDGRNVASTYDSVGNRLSLTYPSGRIVTYAYDAINQVTNVSSSASAMTAPTTLATFAFEGPGRIGRIARTNGINTRYTWNGLVSPPNAAGDFGSRQISRINHSTAGGAPVIDQRRFAYDRNQNKILRAQTAPFFPGGDRMTNIFHYDALNRLHETETTLGASLKHIAYALDGNGNRQLVVSNGVAMPYFLDNTPLPGPADFQMDQYTMTPFAGQAFDENGNRIARNSTVAQLQYQYDYANRLVAVYDLVTGDLAQVASYSYNALGQRISKTVYPPAPSQPVTTEFNYVGDEVVEERDNNAVTASFLRLGPANGGLERLGFGSDSPGLVSMQRNGQDYYYHTDDLGNVLALTDDLGAVVERYDYADFGEPSFLNRDGFPLATNAAPSGNPFLFHGMEWDRETGLYFERSGTPVIEWTFEKAWPCRWDGWNYDPQTARAIRGKEKIIKVEILSHVVGGGNNPWSGITAQYNPKEIGIDKSVPWHSKATRSHIPAGFVAKKNNGQLAGKK